MSNLLLRPINVNTVLIIIAIVAVLAIIFAVLIVSVSKLCAVKEDERAKQNKYRSGSSQPNCAKEQWIQRRRTLKRPIQKQCLGFRWQVHELLHCS